MDQVIRVALGMGLTWREVWRMTERQLLAIVVGNGPDGKRLTPPWLDELARGG